MVVSGGCLGLSGMEVVLKESEYEALSVVSGMSFEKRIARNGTDSELFSHSGFLRKKTSGHLGTELSVQKKPLVIFSPSHRPERRSQQVHRNTKHP